MNPSSDVAILLLRATDCLNDSVNTELRGCSSAIRHNDLRRLQELGRSRLGFASGLVDRSASSPALLWRSKSLRALYSGWLRS